MEITLVIFKEDGQRREFMLHKRVTTVGRGEECDLQIPLPTVSRKHCLIEVQDNNPIVVDLESSNGTYCNNQRITTAQPLLPGDLIRVGPVSFTVLIDGEPTQIKPVRTILGDQALEPVSTAMPPISDHQTVDVENERNQDGPAPVPQPEDDDPIAALERLSREHDEQ